MGLDSLPREKTGSQRKLSRLYRVTSCDGPDITTVKVYFPTDPSIQVHQMRVLKCPPTFPTDFYWYRGKPGRHPKCVQKQIEEIEAEVEQLNTTNSSTDCEREGQTNYQLRNDMLPVPSSASMHSNKITEPVTATVRKKEKSEEKQTT